MNLEERVKKIEKRNLRVECDKAWEVSSFRIILIIVFTYIITSLTFYLINIEKPLLNSLIPMIAFFLSIQGLSPIKRWWIRKYLNKKEETKYN